MKQWQVPQNNGPGEIDEHDMPTEPLPYEVTVPFSPTSDKMHASYHSPSNETFPAPQPIEQPFPRKFVLGEPQGTIGGGAHPFLVPTQEAQKHKGKRSTGSAPTADADQLAKGSKPKRGTRVRRSATPALVGFFFFLVQMLLLTRFVLKVINWPDNDLWVQIVYGLSAVFIGPVYTLAQQISLPFSVWFELYTLLAVLLYGIFSRIIVRLLKAIFYRH